MTQPYPPLALAATLLLAVILTACAPMPPVSEVEAAGQEPHEVPFRRGGYPTLAPPSCGSAGCCSSCCPSWPVRPLG